jgi:tellurite resistance protein TerC
MKNKADARRVLLWIASALLFNLGILLFWDVLVKLGLPLFQGHAHQKALEFLTGYLIEYSLSVDNLFVFIMIFTYFGVNHDQQLRALQWGIAGAIVFRMLFVVFGVALIHLFHEIIYAFGVLLIWSAWKMAFAKEKGIEPDKIPLVRWFRKILPITKDYVGKKFFIRTQAGLAATPLLIVVLVIESSDIMFAIDSIPAILAITQDPFIVISSNIFAILGLRSLYFLLANVMGLFRFLKHGVALILAFVGLKMLLMDLYKLPTLVSLGVIVLILVGSILASKVIKEKEGRTA